jgi:hypothetical protein
MDLTKEENMKLLLSYALSFEEHYDEAVWEIIKGWLSQQKVERLKSVLDEGFIVYAFKKLNKRPLKLLFNTLKVPFSVDSASLDDDDATSKTIQILALSEIKIGSVSSRSKQKNDDINVGILCRPNIPCIACRCARTKHNIGARTLSSHRAKVSLFQLV